MDRLAEEIKSRAKTLGFDVAGIAPATESNRKPELMRWLEAGHHAEMNWLARDPERRADPRRILPNCASVKRTMWASGSSVGAVASARL